jgi:DNA polymerase III subunit alpha
MPKVLKGKPSRKNWSDFGAQAQQNKESAQQSLFGDIPEIAIPDPDLPVCEPWPPIKCLSHEKEVIGFYISGHPSDQFRHEINTLCRNYP